jgi:ribosomal protein S18 acetylase RimI-like enzyme
LPTHDRSFAGDADLPRIAELIGASSGKTPHRIDFPWRLSSPTLQNPRDVRLWVDESGVLLAFAAWQIYWAALDYYVRPGAEQSAVEDEIFAWAATRFRELDQERGCPLPYWIEVREDDAERLATAARHDFILDDDYGYLMLSRSLVDPLPQPPVPEGFTIRPLRGAAEAGDYAALHQAAFNSTSMTPGWRARTLRSPQYQADLDLVAVAPGNELAGFCVCWLDSGGHVGQIEPIGVHPNYQRRGLGRALLAECFRRLATRGAIAALVQTETTRLSARATYESLGFRVAHTILRKGRWLDAPT